MDTASRTKEKGYILGITAKQSFNLAIKDAHIKSLFDLKEGKNEMDKVEENYEKIFNRLLKINTRLLTLPEESSTPEPGQSSTPSKGNSQVPEGFRETGAAWKDKKEPDKKLSVKDKKTETYSSVEIDKLTKTEKGYTYTHDGALFIFEEIPEADRKSQTYPHYKVYKQNNGGENDE